MTAKPGHCRFRVSKICACWLVNSAFPFHRDTEVSARTGLNSGILEEYIKEAVRDRFESAA
jgi:hypothetical protein